MADQTVDYKQMAEALWQLLDDIDTIDDIAKTNDHAYREAARRTQQKRFQYMTSPDGYRLEVVHPQPTGKCGRCSACELERIGCGCDGALDYGCFLCTPSRHPRPECPPALEGAPRRKPTALVHRDMHEAILANTKERVMVETWQKALAIVEAIAERRVIDSIKEEMRRALSGR